MVAGILLLCEAVEHWLGRIVAGVCHLRWVSCTYSKSHILLTTPTKKGIHVKFGGFFSSCIDATRSTKLGQQMPSFFFFQSMYIFRLTF